MGSYLSRPVTDKVSEDMENQFMSCGVSSMQGWREYQEDTHNCILDFDTKASLFAVYDGHGGDEVSQYAADNLPDFVKNELYEKGDYEKSLIKAYLDFDSTLIEPSVADQLTALREKRVDIESDDDNEEDKEDELNELYQEAEMPISEVIKKYKILESKVNETSKTETSKASGSCNSTASTGTIEASQVSGSSNNTESSTGVKKFIFNGVDGGDSVVPCIPDEIVNQMNGLTDNKEQSTSKEDEKIDEKINDEIDEKINDEIDEKIDEIDEKINENDKKIDKNDKEIDNKIDEKIDDIDEVIEVECGPSSSSKCTSRAASITKGSLRSVISLLLNSTDSSDDDDDSSEDEAFEGTKDESDSDDESDEDEDEEDGGDDDDDDDDDDEDEDTVNSVSKALVDCLSDDDEEEQAGKDSGCTAVLALFVDNKLYVANAGDSRCVVSVNGVAHDMSKDHKPEDEPETSRIITAGGRVTNDGRVNGGLNLSRALGDHNYKKNTDLPNTKQMITALPDVAVLNNIEPGNNNFIVLACDGIWNSLTSQEVVDFVSERINKTEKLSSICEELFDHCLAPNTLSDGTGCDNMTCIIVRLKQNQKRSRSAGENGTFDEDVDPKKLKSAESESVQ